MSTTANSEECPEPSGDQDNEEEVNEVFEVKDNSKCYQKCWTSKTQVYVSHFLSSCGDRMWMFAGGLFLLKVTPDSLRLAAFYGASLALVVIVFGAPVGRWVDHTQRLRAVQISLTIQNTMVCVCAAILVIMIEYRNKVELAWNGAAMPVAQVAVIVTACLAQIGTLGSKLTIEKDWIIVICGKDKSRLARMNSILRTVDLSTEVFAPVLVGFIMTGFGMSMGGIFIACWNIVSLFLEYGLLHHLYHSTPALHRKETVEQVLLQAEYKNEPQKSWKQHIASAWSAWILYMNHPVRDAGLGLALLFMTVLAFDNYSRAYVFNLGVAESVLGGLTALASVLGILGSLVFPKMRQKVGLNTTGLIGFSLEVLCLSLCVVSIFLPGSPFELAPGYTRMHSVRNNLSTSDASLDSLLFNESTPMTLSDSPTKPSTPVLNEAAIVTENFELLNPNVDNSSLLNGGESKPVLGEMTNYTELEEKFTNGTTANSSSSNIIEESHSYISVGVLLTGIISSRFGLWVADLTVTQILQEGVADGERGSVNGVQSSLNQILDMCRSILLILLPSHPTFGYLIIISYCFVGAGGLMFFLYTRHPHVELEISEVLDGEEASPVEDLASPPYRE